MCVLIIRNGHAVLYLLGSSLTARAQIFTNIRGFTISTLLVYPTIDIGYPPHKRLRIKNNKKKRKKEQALSPRFGPSRIDRTSSLHALVDLALDTVRRLSGPLQ